MCFSFQFAKGLLEGTSVAAELDPGFEGGKIAAEVLDALDSLRELCSKCGRQLTGGQGHSSFAWVSANPTEAFTQNVFQNLGAPIKTSSVLCADQQTMKTFVSAVMVCRQMT